MAQSNPTTPHGHSMFDISSLIQKAIRRCDEPSAFYAASQMQGMYRNYLWKRLITTAAEDCLGFVVQHILKFKEENNIEDAVATLLHTPKNRDADYFACNLMNSNDKRDLVEEPISSCGCVTKNGHDVIATGESYIQSVLNAEDEDAGYLSNELCVKFKPYFWILTKRIASMSEAPKVFFDELNALKEVDEGLKKWKDEYTLYNARAVVMLLRLVKYGYEPFVMDTFKCEGALNYYGSRFMQIPEYTYDCHTWRGRSKGKTIEHFIVEEQNALKPLVRCEYDTFDWDRFLTLEKVGRHDTYNLPFNKSAVDMINSGGYTPSLF